VQLSFAVQPEVFGSTDSVVADSMLPGMATAYPLLPAICAASGRSVASTRPSATSSR
jgi:hypothetical protein